jgi:hypothetical protein
MSASDVLNQLSLFAGDFIESLSMSLNLRWIIEGKVYIDNYCKALGVYSENILL